MLARSNILVCGGLPRGATTFLYTELSNHKNVHKSFIKESFLFERGEGFVDAKLKLLRKDRIYLDFTPEYIFNPASLAKIKNSGVSCFFVLREYAAWRESLVKYLSINGIRNDFLIGISESRFLEAINYVQENFLTFSIDQVTHDTKWVAEEIQSKFDIDLGERCRERIERNASNARAHYAASFVQNYLRTPLRIATSSLWGMM